MLPTSMSGAVSKSESMSDRARPFSVRSAVRGAVLLPLVLVGAMVYWTLALGLGGISLVAVHALSEDIELTPMAPDVIPPTAAEPVPGHAEQITVQIQESAEPEDRGDFGDLGRLVNDNVGAPAFRIAD